MDGSTTDRGHPVDEFGGLSSMRRTFRFMASTTDRNERLADAMARAGLNSADLAMSAQVDPRTIDRLVADRSRTPRAHSRHAIAEAVQVPVGALWPGASNGAQVTNELLAVYPSRASMPAGLVMSLLGDASERIDILALAGIWLWDAVPGFGSALSAKAESGIAIRVCLGDPDGDTVRIRGGEERIGDLLSARCRLAATYAAQALSVSPDAIRVHDTTLYASILRFDDDLLVNWHLYGVPASESPVLQLRRTNCHGLAEGIASSFDRVWNGARLLVA
jgi:hypothetical protein